MSITLLRPYVTLSDVKRYCGISQNKDEYDEDIKNAINKASRYIDSTTGRYYYKKTYSSEYLKTTKGYDGWSIVLNEDISFIFTPQLSPIIDITTLIENDVTLVEDTDFYVDKAIGMIERASTNWNENPREIVITCNLGYNSADTATPSSDIPGDVAQYALEIASRFSGRFKKSIKNFVSGGSEEIDLFSIPKDIEKALMALRPIGIL